MCTVSWLPGAGGYTLCFNRDERRTRAPEVPPAAREQAGMVFLAPLDGAFGGSWIAVNVAGLTLALLNRYRPSGRPVPSNARSRGLLVLDLIAERTALDALRALERADLSRTAPFSLVTLDPERPPRLTEWDGLTLATATGHAPGILHTSSSVTEPEVAAARRTVFESVLPRTPDELAAVHRSHLPERGRCSICMHRDDAETRSFSQVTVTAERVSLLHVPDAPCRGHPLPLLELARLPLPCPTPA